MDLTLWFYRWDINYISHTIHKQVKEGNEDIEIETEGRLNEKTETKKMKYVTNKESMQNSAHSVWKVFIHLGQVRLFYNILSMEIGMMMFYFRFEDLSNM